MTALIQAKSLSQAFGTYKVFESVSFEVQAGQHLALLGSSGCGKSTLLRLLAGLDAPDDGQIWIDGRLASGPARILVPPHQRNVAMVFQDLALWPTLTVLGNVMLGMGGLSVTKAERRTQSLEALQTCKIDGLAGRKPATLSIGQQQRVALARALASRPKSLLLDEPFSSLDLPLKQELIGELTQLADRFGISLVLVTHDPTEARTICSNALVLESGRICEHGAWADLMRDPASKLLRAFARA